MVITENFAILNILQALGKLSAATGAGNTKKESEAKPDEQKPESREKPFHSPAVTQSLLERHERSVNKIKNAGK